MKRQNLITVFIFLTRISCKYDLSMASMHLFVQRIHLYFYLFDISNIHLSMVVEFQGILLPPNVHRYSTIRIVPIGKDYILVRNTVIHS